MDEIETDPDNMLDPDRLTRLDKVPDDDPWYTDNAPHDPEDFYILARACISCGTVHELVVDVDAYEWWRAGQMVQVAFPNLTADDRELFFISGICGPCYDKMFGA